MKFPWMQFYATDWLNDPAVSMCEPATRGVLIDWLCNMHLLDRCGQISGTISQLARAGRCLPAQVEAALADLKETNAAEIIPAKDGVVTVINRRMKREAKAREHGRKRVIKFRSNAAETQDVTAHSHNSDSDSEKTHTKSVSVLTNLEGKLNEAYNRKPGAQWTYGELSQLAEIARRTDAMTELETILTWRRRMPSADRRYFPQSIGSLLNKWTDTLDKAATNAPKPIKFTPPPALKGERLPDAKYAELAAATLAGMKDAVRHK